MIDKEKFADLIRRAKERAEKMGTESDGTTGAEYDLFPYQMQSMANLYGDDDYFQEAIEKELG